MRRKIARQAAPPEGKALSSGDVLRTTRLENADPAKILREMAVLASGKQISAEQAAQMRDPKAVLGGWQLPQ